MIPVNEPALGEAEIENVLECVRTGWISSAGPFIDEFERKWADYCGMRYGVAVSSGTTALELAVRCLGIGPKRRGDCSDIYDHLMCTCCFAVWRYPGLCRCRA